MGRFASTVRFYARYREPYPPTFFQSVAERLALRGDEALLDVGCGPGPLAIGFAPFVGSCAGLDPEPAMIEAARAAAEAAGVRLTLHPGRIEVRVQQVDATLACSLLAGVWNSKVFRGRWLRRSAILSSSDCV
jgi:SAM-dependent methyltransferase